jgi:hypothetical protein
MRQRRWFSALIAVCFLAVSFNANAQTNDPRATQEAMQHAANLPIAEGIVQRAEAGGNRALDPVYRAEAVRQLAGLSPETLGDISAAGAGFGPLAYGQSGTDLVFVPITPCRIIDTRPAFLTQGGSPYNFLAAGFCGVPFGPAVAVAVNFIAVSGQGLGDIRVTPFGTAIPLASVINYQSDFGAIANGIDMKICNPAVTACTADITIQVDGAPVQVVADVYGYYQRLPPAGRAVAVVQRSPSVAFDAARTRNFATVSRPSTGIYCLTLGTSPAIDPTTTPVYVTIEWANSLGHTLAAYQNAQAGAPCAAGQIQVRTYDFTSNLSDQVSFQVFVP